MAKCIHIINKKSGTKEQCNTNVIAESEFCKKHTKKEKVVVNVVEQAVKCNHVVHKKDGTEKQCNTKTVEGTETCKKHTKVVEKVVKEKVVDEVVKCNHIIHKKDGTEKQCNTKTIKGTETCKRHTKKVVEEVVVVEPVVELVVEPVVEEVVVVELVVEPVIEQVIKCKHIIHKKDGSEVMCTNKAVKGSETCKKHTKKEKYQTLYICANHNMIILVDEPKTNLADVTEEAKTYNDVTGNEAYVFKFLEKPQLPIYHILNTEDENLELLKVFYQQY